MNGWFDKKNNTIYPSSLYPGITKFVRGIMSLRICKLYKLSVAILTFMIIRQLIFLLFFLNQLVEAFTKMATFKIQCAPLCNLKTTVLGCV